MNNYFNNPNSEKMYNYLFNNEDYPFLSNNFHFWVIDFDEEQGQKKVLDFLEELINDVIFLKIEDEFILFYFDDVEIEIKDILSSISDDFGINVKVFASCKIESKFPENFKTIYNFYKKYLNNKPYTYANISDLILEIIRVNIQDLKKIRFAVLNKINDDSQMENLILTMFSNDLNVTQTANQVYMHRNTIINKLEYIKKETSLNLQSFKDANCMYWLIKIK